MNNVAMVFDSWGDADAAARGRLYYAPSANQELGIRAVNEYGKRRYQVVFVVRTDPEFLRGEIEVITSRDAWAITKGKGDFLRCAQEGIFSGEWARK